MKYKHIVIKHDIIKEQIEELLKELKVKPIPFIILDLLTIKNIKNIQLAILLEIIKYTKIICLINKKYSPNLYLKFEILHFHNVCTIFSNFNDAKNFMKEYK